MIGLRVAGKLLLPGSGWNASLWVREGEDRARCPDMMGPSLSAADRASDHSVKASRVPRDRGQERPHLLPWTEWDREMALSLGNSLFTQYLASRC